MHHRFRFNHTLSSRPRAERLNLVYGFSVVLALQQVGIFIPLSPSLGLSRRAETTLLNKSVEISTTTGRFCSRCHLYTQPLILCVFYFLSAILLYHIRLNASRQKRCEAKSGWLALSPSGLVTDVERQNTLTPFSVTVPFQHSRKKLLSTRLTYLSSIPFSMDRITSASSF